MNRSYYSSEIRFFLKESNNSILGKLSEQSGGVLDQIRSWEFQIESLKETLKDFSGRIIFEYIIPRMGKRIDVVLLLDNVVFVLEYKVGETIYRSYDITQVYDYVLDLKDFHEKSELPLLVPVLVSTHANYSEVEIEETIHNDNTVKPIKTNAKELKETIYKILKWNNSREKFSIKDWEYGRYFPTPTIIEKASSLYCANTVENITEKSSDRVSFTNTTNLISNIIAESKANNKKVICFLTGVPGAGKTLVGLEIAAKHLDADRRESCVYLSGNGPLVKVLQEALAIDHVKATNQTITKTEARSKVKLFIQNVHHFRDTCLIDEHPQPEHVAIFDEAQRAWNLKQTIDFMRRKKNLPDFSVSEPEFLISTMDRHKDWAVVLCLVGGGQEINTGEAGISEWIESINRSYRDWNVFISPELQDKEYAAMNAIELFHNQNNIFKRGELHLSVSMRSFRAEKVSEFVKRLLDVEIDEAQKIYSDFKDKYPIILTRDLVKAKKWLKKMARGSQRYGLVTSSKAYRLKPLAIDVRYNTDPVHYFLHDKNDIRSSYYLEDVATEFQVQGLELDWVGLVWDADFRFNESNWEHKNFRGSQWVNINQEANKLYQKNAYRVLLTRARQGMIICIPQGNEEDSTRKPEYYNSTYNYLKSIGLDEL